jgi:hypothetical protein
VAWFLHGIRYCRQRVLCRAAYEALLLCAYGLRSPPAPAAICEHPFPDPAEPEHTHSTQSQLPGPDSDTIYAIQIHLEEISGLEVGLFRPRPTLKRNRANEG